MRVLITSILITMSIICADFTQHINFIFKFESSTIVKTKYEYSKYGISQEILYKYNQEMNTYYEISTLTYSQAEHIAYEMIYKPNLIHKINNDKIALAVFDFCYNSNSVNAVKVIQRVCNDYVYFQRKFHKSNLHYLSVDGKIGENTIKILNIIPEAFFITSYKIARIEYLKSLPRWDKYGRGWRKRVNAI